MDMRHSLIALVSTVAILASPTARAVELDAGGSGQALILPLWATTAGHATVLSMSAIERDLSASAGPPIVRVRLLDRDGEAAFSASLYFRSNEDTWTAAVVSREGGGSTLVTSDDTCVLVHPSTTMPFSGSVDLIPEYGMAEFIVMGGSEATAVQELVGASDCAGLVSRWNSGAWATDSVDGLSVPDTEIRATASIVQVGRGTLYSIDPYALDGFSDIVQHTRPHESTPNLATAHDSGTANGQTTSRVCVDGRCLESTWATPLDAVSAALMAHQFRGNYSVESNLAAKTDLVLSYPVRRYYAERDGAESPLAAAPLAMALWDRTGAPYIISLCVPIPNPPEFCEAALFTSHNTSVAVVSFNDEGPHQGETPSALLGVSRMPLFPDPNFGPIPEAGTFLAGIDRGGESVLTSNEGTHYYGAPALSAVLQQFENGTLQGPDGVQQRANYGDNFAPVRKLWPESYE